MLGFNATKEEALKIWEERASIWQPDGLSPWRPSQGDLALYEKLGADKLRGQVLILGATPELRDLVSRYCKKCLLADMSPSMIWRMTSLLKRADPANETWIKADWCELPLPENYLDLVIGDMPWTVIAVQEQEKLRDKITSVLRADGLLITRARLRNPARVGENGLEGIQRYLEKLDAHPERYHLIGNETVSYLHDVTADVEGKRSNEAKTKALILEAAALSRTPLHKKFLEGLARRTLGADWTSQTREELVSLMGEKFSLVAELRATDYDSEWYPVIAFRKHA